ncbi:hypothetical protein CIG75_01470 [Tumebacillus algifaecis]|uniref:Uncharacterized protein n=1 Tax=Tumebacillus algifaecis TaxID=1214604 RepID=A0A223CWR8_9BACL|nr:DUF4878 domain-containing protein [Tumebacillus algifaecis]ASS73770.1 hypothetical protein CIG75_01470 [Tumebacillus algifaecis]
MKATKIVASITGIMLLAGVIIISNPTRAEQTSEKEAKQAVTHYLNAVSAGDVNEIIKYSKDERVPDDTKRKEMLEHFMQNNPVKQIQVLSVNYINEANINVTISGQFGDTTETKTLPLIKENNQWKVLIEDSN